MIPSSQSERSPHRPAGYSVAQGAEYSRLKLQVILSVTLCYAAYYLVRKDFVMVLPNLAAEGWCKRELGLVMAAMTVTYGLSNFLMGFVADRIPVRKLMPVCLVISALVSLVLAGVTINSCPFYLVMGLMVVNGWVQGVGWPSSAKIIAHWFSREERGRATSFWNLSNNLGAGLLGPIAIVAMTYFTLWQCKLVIPGVIALVVACITLFWLHDRPQDCGLPELQEKESEEKLSHDADKQVLEKEDKGFVRTCLVMPELWLLALLNICVYFVRYGVIDWVPLYMTEERHFSFDVASWAFMVFEFAAIPGTLLCGYLSDRVFRGRRVPGNLLNMSLVLLALLGYWQCSADHWLLPVFMLGMIGFFIYGCVVLLHVHIIDIAPRRYVAACVGFCGLFGYLLGASGSSLLLGTIVDTWGWDWAFKVITFAGVAGLILLMMLWYYDRNRLGPEGALAEAVNETSAAPS